MSDTPRTDDSVLKASDIEYGGVFDAVHVDVSRQLELCLDIVTKQRDLLATHAIELASYANESLAKNQPEFLEGLFDRVKKYGDAHFGVYGTYEKPKGGEG